MIRYKLSTQNKTTHNGYRLPEIDEWFYPEDMTSEPKPCTNTVLHHYAHPVLAALMNPAHADIKNPILWEIEIEEELGTDGLKCWCRAQRLIRQIPLPVLTIDQCTEFAIRCAMKVCDDAKWLKWAGRWLDGTDRSANAANAAANAANAAAYAAYAAYATAYAAAYAAYATAYAAAYAAYATAYAAAYATAYANKNIDFLAIIAELKLN